MRHTTAAFACLLAMTALGCKFPYPADVPDDDVTDGRTDGPLDGRAVGGTMSGLWTGGSVTLHLEAGALSEDFVADAAERWAFLSHVPDGETYSVGVVDDGADHDCRVSNGAGTVMGADVTDIGVDCTNLIPHSFTISAAVPFTFDPRVTRYPLPGSRLQQEVSVLVTGASLTGATLAGQPVSIGEASDAARIPQGQGSVVVEVMKGPLGRRYELAFDRGAQPIVEALYARASNPGNDDVFGAAVAASNDFIAVGAYGEDSSTEGGNDNSAMDSGAVYLFRRTGDSWVFSQRVKGSAISATRGFGHALAIDGDVLVVGAFGDDARGVDAGAAYVYRYNVGTGFWAQEQRLTASEARAGDQFGRTVGVSGDLIVVSSPLRQTAPGSGTAAGSVYTFRYNGVSWIEESPLRTNSSFGWRLAFDHDLLALGTTSNNQLIALYRWSGASWVPETLPAVAGASFDVEGDVLAVGEPTAGGVRIFSRANGAWTETALLHANPPTGGAGLGGRVALHGDLIVTSDSVTPAYIFQREGASWSPLPPLTVSGSPIWSGNVVAPSLAIAGNCVVVGDPWDGGPGQSVAGSGTAWIFR